MPRSLRGMSMGSGIDVISPQIRAGCMLRVLAVSDPDYGNLEAYDGEPEACLTLDEIAFWQSVLDHQRELALARR